MSLISATIVFNDSSSKYNKDLTDFLSRSLEDAIRKGRLSFIFKIVKPSDFDGLRRIGVEKLPAMIINGKPFVGVPAIIAEVRARIRTSRIEAPVKSDDELVRDFQIQSLGRISKDADGKIVPDNDMEEDTDNKSMMSAYMREIQRRGMTAGHGEADPFDRPARMAPSKASREHERDDDDDDFGGGYQAHPTRRNHANTQAMPRHVPRDDNLDNGMDDALDSLRNIGGGDRSLTNEQRQEDAMMQTLLAKM